MTSLSRVATPAGLVRAALLVAAMTIGGCSPSSSADASKAPPSQLIGAWQSNVQFSSGAFAPIKDLRFLYVFNAGGTMTESSNYDGAPPVPPAYGVWRETGPSKFEAKYVFYITKVPTAFKDIASGGGWLPTGHGVLTESITLGADGKSFDSTIRYEAFDMSGKPAAGSGEATTHGTRIAF
jgi:hypothetical protein